VSGYWERHRLMRTTRRRFIGGAAVAGIGASGLALVGCGDDDDTGPAPTTAPQQTQPAGQASPTQEQVTRGGTIRYPMVGVSSGNPPTLYPFENLTYLAQIPASYHYSRLLRAYGGEGIEPTDNTKLEGDLAAKWEQPDSAGLTYVFTFKPNVKWHDKAPLNGRAATATDWVNTYDAFLAVSQNAPGWKGVVDKVEAPDEKTLRITLKAPFAPFTVTHASSAEAVWFIPVETITNEQVKRDPVGTGPYVFEKFETGVAITWKKNPTYFDAPLPNFDRVEAGLINDPQRLVAALQSGDYDMSLLNGPVYGESRNKLDAKGKDTFIQNLVQGGFYFNFDSPPWQDARVRQALSMALDRDGYLKIQDGTKQGNWMSHLPPGLAPFYLSPRDRNADFGEAGKFFKKNVAEAKALLKAATGQDTISFKLYANVDRYGAEAQQAWELFKGTISEAGFNAELEYQEYGSYIQSTFLGKIPAGGIAVGPLIGSPRDPDNIFMSLYWSQSNRHNWGGTPITEQAKLDEMFVKQRTILDANERENYIKEIQKEMAKSMLIVPYHASAGWHYAQPWMKNFYYKAAYSNIADGTMKAYFTEERLRKG
jgi:peptide/nickel transport system substrate-binding protein